MPKIPTYVSTSSMTTATPSVKTNVQDLNVNQTPASALQPVSNFVRDSYIKEKITEANNQSYKAINNFYEDQLDPQGNVAQKGWLTIQSEAKQKSNPTEASEYYDLETEKLYNYHKNNKLKNLNNFEKKAIDAKFYATSGLLKTKAIEEARLNLITENKEVDDDTFVKQSLLLQQLGPMYLSSFTCPTHTSSTAPPTTRIRHIRTRHTPTLESYIVLRQLTQLTRPRRSAYTTRGAL